MAEQYHVDLKLTPQLTKRHYALWVLSRSQLASLLMGSIGLHGSWKLAATTHRETKEGQFHPTACGRRFAPTPLRDFLEALDTRKKPGRVLYHGMGRDVLGLEAMSRGGRDEVVGYDPFHPEPERRLFPLVKFDEVFSIYTLNVVPAVEGISVLGEIYDVLKSNGKAIIAVRRDL